MESQEKQIIETYTEMELAKHIPCRWISQLPFFSNRVCWVKRQKLVNALLGLTEHSIVQNVRQIKEGKNCPWDPALSFYHLMGVVGEIKDNCRICSTGDGYVASRCVLKAWMEFFERLSVILAYNAHLYKNDETFVFKLFPFRTFLHQYSVKTTSGCAIHFKLVIAMKNAASELIERDAFLCHWYTKTPAYFLKTEDPLMPKQIKKMHLYLQQKGWSLSCLKLNSVCKEIHVILLLCLNKSNDAKTFVFLGLGADANLKKAIVKAYFEIAKFYTKLNSSVELQEIQNQLPGELEKEPFGRLLFYQNRERIKEFSFLFDSQYVSIEDIKWKEMSENKLLEIIQQNRQSLSFQMLPIPYGLKNIVFAVRAFDPNLQDLDFENQPQLNLERLYEFSQSRKIHPVLHPIP